VHGTTTSIVKRRQCVEPSVGVPSPAGDGAVDYGAPEEAEQKRGNDAAALKGAPDDDLNCAGGKEELVEAEDDLGKVNTAGRGSSDDVSHAKVLEVANEGAGCAGKCEGVSPEYPLKRGPGLRSDNVRTKGESVRSGEKRLEMH